MVEGVLTLEQWFAGRGEGNLGESMDGYFTTLGGKMLNPRVEISRLGLGGLQEVVFHGRLKGGSGRVAVFILHGATLLEYAYGVLQVWCSQVLGCRSCGARRFRGFGL